MKKVLVAVALVMGLGSSVAFAQEVIRSIRRHRSGTNGT